MPPLEDHPFSPHTDERYKFACVRCGRTKEAHPPSRTADEAGRVWAALQLEYNDEQE